MASILKVSNLSDIKPFKTEWRVEVKVLHKWCSFDHQSGASIEMFLADQNGVKIHARCKQALMPKLERHFRVGEWLVITNFVLSQASGFNRPTNHAFKMVFVNQTSISDSNIQCENMFLDLHDFAKVLNGLHDPTLLIDVVGQVLAIGGIDIVPNGRKEVEKLEFTLRDIKDQRLHCCITGRLAHKLNQEGNKPNTGDICLLRFAKLLNYNGVVQVSNAFDSSLFMINPDIAEVHAMKALLINGGDKSIEVYQPKNDNILIQKKPHKWSQFPFKTIQEMKHTDKGGCCRVICTVYAIDTMGGWFYFACVVCKKKVFQAPIAFDELNEPNWWCDWCHCSVRKVSPRYKLALLVQDLTGESQFNLFDSAATFIVKASAAKVLNQRLDVIENREMLPLEILAIVGKTYGFGISSDGNKIFSGIEFNALKVWNLADILLKRTKSLHQIATSSRKKHCLTVDEVENGFHDEDENKSG